MICVIRSCGMAGKFEESVNENTENIESDSNERKQM